MNDTFQYGYYWFGVAGVALLALLTYVGVCYYTKQCNKTK